jgi:glutaminyl-tRNA synthetase
VIKNDAGEVTELRCSYDPDTRSGTGTSDRKVKGTIHWVSAAHAMPAEVRLYDRLFTVPDPNAAEDFMSVLNPESLTSVRAMLEPSLYELAAGEAVQFERLGYFCADDVEGSSTEPVFNRIVTLRDSWAKIEQQAIAEHS